MTTVTDGESPEVIALLNEMREKNGKIIAHPFMYVSGLHNKSACYPVDQTDPFFQENGIEFLQLPEEGEGYAEAPEATHKYFVYMDESGAYRHIIEKKSEQ